VEHIPALVIAQYKLISLKANTIVSQIIYNLNKMSINYTFIDILLSTKLLLRISITYSLSHFICYKNFYTNNKMFSTRN
jgi:hypothetical protein